MGSFAELSSVGALVRKKDDSLLVVPFGDHPVPIPDSEGPQFARGHSSPVDHESGAALYWIHGHRLLRRVLDASGQAGPVEPLADDADDGVTPAVVRLHPGADPTGRDVVAFAHASHGVRGVRLWIEGRGFSDPKDEALSASSVALNATSPTEMLITYVDQRAAMTPVHTVRVTLAPDGEARWSPDHIVWFGSASDVFTRASALVTPTTSLALLATEHTALLFGLAAVDTHDHDRPLDDASWLDYPNGLDPAPVVAAPFCHLPAALAVIPTEAAPKSPRAVQLLTLSSEGAVTARAELTRGEHIDHLAAWLNPSSASGEGWIAWLADGRTWMEPVKCPGSPRGKH